MSSDITRIISLVPSLTELIIDLGMEDQLVGRTRFCIHPKEKVDNIEIIGGTKNPRLDKVRDLNPDLIIANKEENRREDIQALQEDFEVNVTEITTIEDALIVIHELAKTFDKTTEGKQLITNIQQALEARPEVPKLNTAYLIWKDPWMTVGRDTYIHDILDHWNLPNVFANKKRYPKITLEDIKKQNPDLILLSSEPYPFKEKHMTQIEEACPAARVLLVEGEWFSWYGSRMEHAFKRLNGWRKTIV